MKSRELGVRRQEFFARGSKKKSSFILQCLKFALPLHSQFEKVAQVGPFVYRLGREIFIL